MVMEWHIGAYTKTRFEIYEAPDPSLDLFFETPVECFKGVEIAAVNFDKKYRLNANVEDEWDASVDPDIWSIYLRFECDSSDEFSGVSYPIDFKTLKEAIEYANALVESHDSLKKCGVSFMTNLVNLKPEDAIAGA